MISPVSPAGSSAEMNSGKVASIGSSGSSRSGFAPESENSPVPTP